MGPLVIPAITAGVQAGFGIYRGIQADRALRELQKQRMPEIMDAADPLRQNIAMAQRQYTQGLAPQSRDLAVGTMASQMAAQRRAATDLAGGQMSTAIGRIGAFNTNQFGLNLGAQNQMARERGMQQLMSANTQFSGLQQMDLREKIRQRLLQEQGYGLAKQQAMQDVVGAVGGFGMAALNNSQFNKMMSLYGGNQATGAGTGSSSSAPFVEQRPILSGTEQSLVNNAPLATGLPQKAVWDNWGPQTPYEYQTSAQTLGSQNPGTPSDQGYDFGQFDRLFRRFEAMSQPRFGLPRLQGAVNYEWRR
jgi:hypothetical protein